MLIPCRIQALGSTRRCPGLGGDRHAQDMILWPVVQNKKGENKLSSHLKAYHNR